MLLFFKKRWPDLKHSTGRGAGAVVRAEQSAQLPSYMTAFIALLVVVAVAACQSLVDTQVAVAVVEPR